MKKLLLTLVFFVVLIPALFAQDGRSIVRVRLSDNTPLRVAIDNKSYQEEGKVVTVDNITAGRHRLKVFVPATSGRGRRTLVYEGEFKTEVGSYTYIVVDRIKGTVRTNTGYRTNLDRDTEKFNNNGKNPGDRGRGYNNDNRRGGRDFDDGDYRRGYRNALSTRDMQDLSDRVEDRMHTADKVNLMKAVLSDRTYTTDQIQTMLGWISFDDSKLDFAKWAYDNVTDKRNYWKVEGAFSFSSTKNSFSDYLVAKQ